MANLIDEPTYKKFITGPIKRFNETNHCYSRGGRREIVGHWEIAEKSLEKQIRNIPGFTQEERALFLAGRFVDYTLRRVALTREMPEIWETAHRPKDANGVEVPPAKMPINDPAEMSRKIKQVAKYFLGADLVSICKLNLDWFYSHWGTHTVKRNAAHEAGAPVEVSEKYRWAIVMAVQQDYENIKRSPAQCQTVDLAYSKMAWVASSLAVFIRELGYKAIPMGNEMALSIPMAIDAGLGELGRNGLLITEKFGPRVRLCKVITDLHLEPDKPVDLGVQAFCETCKICADNCPGRAIKHGERTDKPWNISNNEGVLKWPVDGEKCLGFWVKNGTWCANCVRVCPWNKPHKGWSARIHGLVRWVVARTPYFNRLLVKTDKLFGYGKQVLKSFPQLGKYGNSYIP